ncbi:MAG: hypothetical protein EOP51_09015 [Sphingobacteriales bacterium]|nr:MAG: hypothetical protein EOP51_09015 [Sphingobacteriales bacterium]
MRAIKIIFMLGVASSCLHAQTVTNSKRAADVYFLNKEYFAAAKYYQKALRIAQDSAFVVPYGFEANIKQDGPKKEEYEYAVFQLANSLRLYRNYQDAEKWYAIAVNFTDPKYALSRYWYGECLRANLRYEEAITAFTTFIATYNGAGEYKNNAKLEIESCKFALTEMQYPRLVKLQKLPKDVNALGSNYSPILNRNTFYFTSSRPISTSGKTETLTASTTGASVEKKETPYVNSIYTATGNLKDARIEIEKVFSNLKNLESAAPAIHPNGEVMFMTLWVNKPDKKRNIYSSKKVDNKWTEPVLLGGEVNVMGYNAMQPFVSGDGKYLIFSSDRPGGQGKYDLWFAPLRSDFSLGNAINFGTTINTREDEQAPYYNAMTKNLLFSSNGRVGMGGFDFYESNGDFSKWTLPANMGYPFNSAKDDIYFAALDDAGKEAYISSDRESVCCLEVFHVVREYLSVQGTILDCVTKKPLAGATITAVGTNIPEQVVKTDANGRYLFQVGSNRDLQIHAMKDKYFAKNINYNYAQLFKADTLLSSELCLEPMVINKPIVLKNILYEFNSAELTEDSKGTLDTLFQVMIDNPNIEIELSAHTDNIGSEPYNLDLSDKRAKSCVDYLMIKGITPDRLTSKGYGFSKPVAPNQLEGGKKDYPEGRAQNRRTEFKVTKQKQIE